MNTKTDRKMLGFYENSSTDSSLIRRNPKRLPNGIALISKIQLDIMTKS